MTGDDFKNELAKVPYNYDIKSIHAERFGGESGYLINRDDELADLKNMWMRRKEGYGDIFIHFKYSMDFGI